MRGSAFLPIVLVTSAIIIEFVVAGALLVYYFNSTNFGARLSAEALTAASAGIEDGIMKVVRDKNYFTTGYALNVGNRQATVSVCKDICSGNGTHQITAVGQALTQRRQLVAIVETNSVTGQVKVISIKEVPL